MNVVIMIADCIGKPQAEGKYQMTNQHNDNRYTGPMRLNFFIFILI